MSGSGNDFVMLDGRDTKAGDWPPEQVAAICDRRQGVGADGLVILTPEGPQRIRMEYWNCDGSRAAMCGNAALCATRLAVTLGMARPEDMLLLTDAGSFRTRCLPAGEEAELDLPDVAVPVPAGAVKLEKGEKLAFLAQVGVPHLVVRVDTLEQPELMERGRTLRSHPALGSEGANVNFVAPANGSSGGWCLRTYERGVEGETWACGTGAVAAAIGLAHLGQATLPVRIQTRSKRWLEVAATLSGTVARGVRLKGEGRLVFQGLF
jgi:diaminopimelate epimerase